MGIVAICFGLSVMVIITTSSMQPTSTRTVKSISIPKLAVVFAKLASTWWHNQVMPPVPIVTTAFSTTPKQIC